MALTKITKHIVHGSMLIQYKYTSGISGNSSGTGDTQVGATVAMTPQYADSILENHFSGDVHAGTTANGGDNNHFRLALYVNGTKEYEQTELMGGPRGGHQATHHGGNSNRIYANSVYGYLYNLRQSVGFTHNMTPGNTNVQTSDIRLASYDNSGKTMTLSNGFLIVKEISIGITSLSGAQ